MSRKFLTPIVLPADPTAALEAATKQYVDGLIGAGEVFIGPTDPGAAYELWVDEDAVSPAAAIQPWINVTFQNGWVSETPQQGVQYRKISDIVYLRGSMKNGTIGAQAFVLPTGYCPPAQLRPHVLAYSASGQVFGRADLHTNGSYVPYLGSGGNQFVAVDFQFSVTA